MPMLPQLKTPSAAYAFGLDFRPLYMRTPLVLQLVCNPAFCSGAVHVVTWLPGHASSRSLHWLILTAACMALVLAGYSYLQQGVVPTTPWQYYVVYVLRSVRRTGFV